MARNTLRQPPPRNASLVGVGVFSHSGEFQKLSTDVTFPGRGPIFFSFTRCYRSSRVSTAGPLGYGWTFAYAQQLGLEGDQIVYHDGTGQTYSLMPDERVPLQTVPLGLYAILLRQGGSFVLQHRGGFVATFEPPEAGGRLKRFEDPNGNAITLAYLDSEIEIIDTIGNRFSLGLADGRIATLEDATGRTWHYKYNDRGCLAEVLRPATPGYPSGTLIQYSYDAALRLISISDPNGQTYLRNTYDDLDRVVFQDHGTGHFAFSYKRVGATGHGYPTYRTHVQQTNGGKTDIDHDQNGHAVAQTLQVSAASILAEERGEESSSHIPLTIRSRFNGYGELVERIYPQTNANQYVYDETNDDPRDRGNLLSVIARPAARLPHDQTHLMVKCTYAPKFQRIQSIISPRGHQFTFAYDSRGNLAKVEYPPITAQDIVRGHAITKTGLVESYEYNEFGQLKQVRDTSNVSTVFYYFPATDPLGTRAEAHDLSQMGGLLARIIRDPEGLGRAPAANAVNLMTGFKYDSSGNVTAVLDAASNATRFEYDSLNKLTGITSRAPFNYRTAIKRDANGNAVSIVRHFERNAYDPIEASVTALSSELREQFEYNSLNNLVSRSLFAGGTGISERFLRDPGERIVQRIGPMGNVRKYAYDERDLLLKWQEGAGAGEIAFTHSYTKNGWRRSVEDPLGRVTLYNFDAFGRYRGYVGPDGTTLTRSMDEAGNVTHLKVAGNSGQREGPAAGTEPKNVTLAEVTRTYDELSRLMRTDYLWRNPVTNEALGSSGWDDAHGVVSRVVEYADNHLPFRIWTEGRNVISFTYDGANRITRVSDAAGHVASCRYDLIGNPVRVLVEGPVSQAQPDQYRQEIVQEFDQLGRVSTRSTNRGPKEFWRYNALDHVVAYTNAAGADLKLLHDPFGRWSGRALRRASSGLWSPRDSLIFYLERDSNGYITAHIDAAGHRTQFSYDDLGHVRLVVYSDGTTCHLLHDASGNVTRARDPEGRLIVSTWDSCNRLIRRTMQMSSEKSAQPELFRYDGMGRLVSAARGKAVVRRTYDTLSRLITECQSGRLVGFTYDGAGNATRISYPSGYWVERKYDILNRITQISSSSHSAIATYKYRAGTQRSSAVFSRVLETSYEYDPKNNYVAALIYRSAQTGEVVNGTCYLYDPAGNRLQELNLPDRKSGQRYAYDNANRLIRVRYDVADVPDAIELIYSRRAISSYGPWYMAAAGDSSARRLHRCGIRYGDPTRWLRCSGPATISL